MLNIPLDTFKTLFNLRWCDWDGAAGNQCFDLAQFWNFVLGGQPFTGATADLIYNQPQTIYVQVANTPSNFPVAGDIIVWKWPHVGIVISADANQVTVLEQNDPTDSNCHIKTYDYSGVIGWLHPKQLPEDPQAELSQSNADRDTNYNLALALFNALGISLDPNNKEASKQEGVQKINDLKTQHDQDILTITAIKKTNSDIEANDAQLAERLLAAEHATQDAVADRKAIYDKLGVATTQDALSAIIALQKPTTEAARYIIPVMEEMYKNLQKGKKITFSEWVQLGFNLFIKKGGK